MLISTVCGCLIFGGLWVVGVVASLFVVCR